MSVRKRFWFAVLTLDSRNICTRTIHSLVGVERFLETIIKQHSVIRFNPLKSLQHTPDETTPSA